MAQDDRKESLRSFIDAYAAELQATLDEQDSLIDRLSQMQHILAEMLQDAQDARREQAQTMTARLEEFSALESHLAPDETCDASTAEKRVAELETLLAQKEETLRELEAHPTQESTAGDLEAIEEESIRLQARLEDAEIKHQTACLERDQLAAELGELREQLARDAQKHREEEARHATMQEELEALREYSDNAGREKQAIEEKTHVLRLEIERLEAALAQAPTPDHLKALQQHLDEVQSQNAVLQKKLDEELDSGMRAELARQLADALNDVDKARKELNALKQNLEQPQSEEEIAEDEPVQEISIYDIVSQLPQEKKKNLSDLLISANIISPEQLKEAMANQKSQADSTLCGVLLHSGLVDERQLAEIISLHSELPLTTLQVEAVDPDVTALLPDRIAHMYCCVPVKTADDEIEVAMANPTNLQAIEDIERAVGKRVRPVVAVRSEIEAVISKYYWEPD